MCPLIVDELGLQHQVGRLTAVCRTTQVRDQQVTGCFRSCHRQQSLTTELHVSHNLVAVGHLLLADREATIRCCHEQTRGILNQTLMVFGLSQQCAVILQDTRMRVFTLIQDTQRSTATFVVKPWRPCRGSRRSHREVSARAVGKLLSATSDQRDRKRTVGAITLSGPSFQTILLADRFVTRRL